MVEGVFQSGVAQAGDDWADRDRGNRPGLNWYHRLFQGELSRPHHRDDPALAITEQDGKTALGQSDGHQLVGQDMVRPATQDSQENKFNGRRRQGYTLHPFFFRQQIEAGFDRQLGIGFILDTGETDNRDLVSFDPGQISRIDRIEVTDQAVGQQTDPVQMAGAAVGTDQQILLTDEIAKTVLTGDLATEDDHDAVANRYQVIWHVRRTQRAAERSSTRAAAGSGLA